MSLTSFLEKNADVRARFKQEFASPSRLQSRAIVASPNSKHFGTVGMAFDYLIRFLLQKLNPNAIDKRYWIAEAALERITDDAPLLKKGERIIENARRAHSRYLKTGQMTDDIIEAALLLATLDPIFRAGVGHEKIGETQSEDVDDLRSLIAAVEPKLFTAREICLLNPTFGAASKLVNGADADIVIDDTIIDVKTTKYFELTRNYYDQILGYYVLHQIGGLGGTKPRLPINKVGIYYARYAHLHVMPLSGIINPRTFPHFVKWFRKRAKSAFR